MRLTNTAQLICSVNANWKNGTDHYSYQPQRIIIAEPQVKEEAIILKVEYTDLLKESEWI